MKLKDARENYYYYSQKASEIVRQLGLAGIALVWVFKTESNGNKQIPAELIKPTLLIVVSLTLDFMQYAVGALVWSIYNRLKEKSGITEENEFFAPPQINWATTSLFWVKITSIAIAYIFLLRFLANKTF